MHGGKSLISFETRKHDRDRVQFIQQFETEPFE